MTNSNDIYHINKIALHVAKIEANTSGLRVELVKLFAQCLNIEVSGAINANSKFFRIHENLRAFEQTKDKIGAIRFLRDHSLKTNNDRLSLVYAKNYVEWVWGMRDCEPVYVAGQQ